jgi:hypothetical protein
MRLRIDTTQVKFRVAGMPKARPDFRDKSKQATTPDGRPIWSVRLTAIDTGAGSTETIWVEVTGQQPELVLDEVATVAGLVFSPWVSKRGEIMRSFRADEITQGGGTARGRAA